jgi:hypothetical protein
MLKHFSVKLFLVLLLPSLTYGMSLEQPTNPSTCFTFPPLTQPDDLTLTKKREKFDKSPYADQFIVFEKMHAIFPNNTILETVPKKTRSGVCFNFAMRECLGLSKTQFEHIEQCIIGMNDWVLNIGVPYKFFDQIQFPEAGCLVTYHNKNNFIGHFGQVTLNGKIKSKIGTRQSVIEHDYWDVPPFGQLIYFWELKPIYHDQKGKDRLFSEIIDIVQKSMDIKLLLVGAHITLCAAAAQKSHRTKFSEFVYKGNLFHLLQAVTGLNIDLPDDDGNTPLMLAAQVDNQESLISLIEHGAQLDLKNKNGKDALALAQENNHQAIVDILSVMQAKKRLDELM